MKAKIRKIATFLEETQREMDREISPPTRKAAAVAVIENPCAGKYVEDLSELMAIGEELGELLTTAGDCGAWEFPAPPRKATAKPLRSARTENWSMPPRSCIPSWGRRSAACWEKARRLIPSSKKRGGMGVVLDIPLGHKDAAFVRSHFDGMEVRLNDAPRANEIMVAVAVTDSGRPLPRVGGLTKDQIKGEDGLR